MTRRLLLMTQSGLLISVLASGCSRESFPVTPTPVERFPVVLQGNRYQGNITPASGATTSFNMTVIARGLSAPARVAPATEPPGLLSLTGNFETGSGLRGAVQGTLTGTLDYGTFNGSLTADSGGHVEERRYSGHITLATVAWLPGDCLQGCARDELKSPIQASTPTAPPCSYSISANRVLFFVFGGTASVQVSAAASCAWIAESFESWINLVGPATGAGDGTVTFTAPANPGAVREGRLRIAGQTLDVTQAAEPCVYRLTPASALAPADGGTFNTLLAVTGICAGTWNASSDSSWLSGISPDSGTTGATITYVVASNPGTSERTGHLTVQGPAGTFQLTVVQSATRCTYALNPTGQTVPSAGGPFNTTLTTTCSGTWTASSDVPWITIVSPSGTTSATIAYTVQVNSGAARIGHIIVLGAGGTVTFTVSQAPTACEYTLTPITQPVPAAGGSFNIVLALTAPCSGSWTASSDRPWIQSISPASGTTGGTLTYVVAPNSGAVRNGQITVQGPGGISATITVIQAAAAQCTYALDPATQLVPAAGGGSFTTALTASCSWTASSDVPWIRITSGVSGTTNGLIAYTVEANSGPPRVGHVTVLGPGPTTQLSVIQSGCTSTLTPATQSVLAAGGSFSTVLALTGSCSGSWTASIDVPWISITSGASGTTGATIAYTVQVNPGAARTGHVTVQGAGGTAILTVSQDAAPCTYTLNPTTQLVAAGGGGPFSTALTLAGSCSGSWSASSDVSWIQGVSPVSGTAGAIIAYTVQVNSGPSRIGRIIVQGPGGSATLTVTQDPPIGVPGGAR
jgi:hypothetical protein